MQIFSKNNDSEIQSLKPDSGEDYIVIYKHFVGKDTLYQNGTNDRSKKYLNRTLKLFNNAELKGDPSFIINMQDIKKGSLTYNFKDSFIGECYTECTSYKYIPIDFIRVYQSITSLAVKDYTAGIARVEDKNKSYYFKFSISDANEYSWRYYKSKENIKKILEKNSGFNTLKVDLEKCIKNKDFKCLEDYIDKDNLTIDDIVNEAKKRAVLDSEKLCERIETLRSTMGISVYDVPDDLLREVKDFDFFWKLLEKTIATGNKNLDTMLKIKEFGTALLYNVRIPLEKEKCDNRLDIVVSFYNENNKWKIVSIKLTAFQL